MPVKKSRIHPRVSIVIVFYAGIENLLKCLGSIKRQHTKYSYEVIIVNNGKESIDEDIRKILPKAVYIRSPRNGGYGYGNNFGAKMAKGEYLFILNPDVKLLPGIVDRLVSFLDTHINTGIAAPNQFHEDGTIFEKIGSRTLTPFRGGIVLSFLNSLFPNNPISKKYFMKDIPNRELREVDAVPGSAFMIRKKIFEEVGRFDQNIFLFYEEHDLGKRVKDSGYKIFIVPDAKVIHLWEGKNKLELKEYADDSRFCYFKKHYGIVNALLVESFARFSKWHAALLGILLIGTFLRFWKLSENMSFIGDYGWFYLSASDIFTKGIIPLVSIPSSVPILHQGALWTWLLAGALWIGNFDPVYGGYIAAFIGVVSVVVTYFTISKLFSKFVGLLASIFVATSPLIMLHDRNPICTVPIFLITLLIVWFSNEIAKGKDRFFLLGLLFATVFQFELAAFIMVPIVVIGLLWHRIEMQRRILKLVQNDVRHWLELFAGAFFGLLPFIIYDFKNGVFIQTIGFGVWFLQTLKSGIVSVITQSRARADLLPASTYLKNLVFPYNTSIALCILIISFCYFVYKYLKASEKSFIQKLTIVWFLIGVSSFFVRGSFSEAYIPLLYFPVTLVIATLLNDLITWKKVFVPIVVIYFVALFIYDLQALSIDRNPIPYVKKLAVADYIVSDAKGRDFKLRYFGAQYMFEAGDNHYQYLLWWKGNEPKQTALLEYTIVEYPYNDDQFNFVKKKDFGNVTVGVSER